MGATIYIRAVNIERDGEQYGTYYQAVRSYRESGRVRQEVIHLGEHQTAVEALTAWEQEIEKVVVTRPKQARKLQAKLERLRVLSGLLSPSSSNEHDSPAIVIADGDRQEETGEIGLESMKPRKTATRIACTVLPVPQKH